MGISPPRLPDHTDPTGDQAETAAGSSRRRFLTRVATGGAVLAAGSQLVPVGGVVPAALAQDGGDNVEDQDAELSPDEMLVEHLAGLCLAAARGFAQAVDPETSPLSEPVAEVVRQLGANHNEQAAALNELLPIAVENGNTTLEQELATSIAGAVDEDAALGVLRDLEESLTATEYVLLGAIEDQNDAKAVAAVLSSTGQQVVVLGSLAGVALADLVPDEQAATGNLPVASYPTDTRPGTAEEVPGQGPLGNEGGQGPEVGNPNDLTQGEG